jgi:UDP-N-acetyl-D-galactosamine dehydrogenase
VADPVEAYREYGLEIVKWEDLPVATCMVMAVAHQELVSTDAQVLSEKIQPHGCVVDVKSQLDLKSFEQDGYFTWRL